MPFLRPVNLPLPLILQSVASVGLGCYLTIFGHSPFIYGTHAVIAPSNPSPRARDSIRFLGILIAALEGNYLVTSYMPFEENQFIASSIPVRLAISLTLGTLALVNRKSMSVSGFWEYVGIAIVDGAAAVILGMHFGRYDGMLPAITK